MVKVYLLSVWYLIVLALKGIITYVTYPIVYPFHDWAKSRYKINWFAWFCWLHFDEEQPPWGPDWYNGGVHNFYWAYRWSVVRNAMYNVNYNYLSNHSPVVSKTKRRGDLPDKVRTRNGDRGLQYVVYITEDGRTRFLWSYASSTLTWYYGWNVGTSGRYTVAFKANR